MIDFPKIPQKRNFAKNIFLEDVKYPLYDWLIKVLNIGYLQKILYKSYICQGFILNLFNVSLWKLLNEIYYVKVIMWFFFFF